MTSKVFRNTSYVFLVLILIAAFAAESSVGDDAGFADRFLAYSPAVNPWIISAVIVWAAGEIIGAIRGRESEPKE